MVVALTSGEVIVAATVGSMRRVKALNIHRDQTYGEPDNPWDADIEAACAELAFCKAVGIWWPGGDVGSTDKSRGDAILPSGTVAQIRWTRHESGRLLVYERDPLVHLYVLVIGAAPTFRVAGAMLGAFAMAHPVDPKMRSNPHAVPQFALDPISLWMS